MKILIVGAGASGVSAAINYKRNHREDDVLVIEHLSLPLKKLLATGNGRCNLGNSNLDINKYSHQEFVEAVLKEYNYTKFFDSISIKTKLIGDLAYPISESAVSVRNAFLNEAIKLGIKINVDEKLVDYKMSGQIEVTTSKNKYVVDKLYLASSLLSGNGVGSDGSVLEILKKHQYKIVNPKPGLCPISTFENTKILDGIRNKCEVFLYENSHLIHQEKGEVLFRKNGLSGIVIFNASSLIARSEKKASKIVLDLLPDFSSQELQNYRKSHTFSQFLQAFLHPKLIEYLSVRFKDENALFDAIKSLEFNFKDFDDFNHSQVSVGGVDISMVKPNLESVKENNVFIIGELLDVDGPCGGYNLTFAFASGIVSTK